METIEYTIESIQILVEAWSERRLKLQKKNLFDEQNVSHEERPNDSLASHLFSFFFVSPRCVLIIDPLFWRQVENCCAKGWYKSALVSIPQLHALISIVWPRPRCKRFEAAKEVAYSYGAEVIPHRLKSFSLRIIDAPEGAIPAQSRKVQRWYQ